MSRNFKNKEIIMVFGGKKITLRYIANTGISLEYKDKKILIDGVHLTFVKPYFTVPKETLNDMIMGRSPYNKIDVMLFTHHHLDHFDAHSVCEILKHNRFTQLIGPTTVSKLIQASPNFDPITISQINNFAIPPYKSMNINIKEISFEIFSMKHDGERYINIENFAYYIDFAGKRFLHVGDSAPSLENYELSGIYEKDIDILFVPFPYIGLRAGREIIKKIRPKQLFVMHLPDKKHDSSNWIYSTYKVFKQYEKELPKTEFLTNPGQEIIIK